MSSNESDTCEIKNKEHKTKFKPLAMSELKELQISEIFVYIGKLHKILRKNDKKLKHYQAKISHLINKIKDRKEEKHEKDRNKATAEVDQLKSENRNNTIVEEKITAPIQQKEQKGQDLEKQNENGDASAAFSFVDEMRQAAEHAKNLNGMIYEPTSGLYYDQKSGYYYNAEYGLYYDGNTGCYYSYNTNNKSYEFHSQVHVQPSQEIKQQQADDIMTEILFDEWGGVITDKVRLQQLREEKEQHANKNYYKKHKKDKHKKDKEYTNKKRKSHKHKKDKKKTKKRKNAKDDCSEDDYDDDTSSHKQREKDNDIEDGELSTTSSSSSSHNSSNSYSDIEDNDDDKNDGVEVFHKGSRFQDIAKKYPPSLRIIVQETNLENLKVGNLSLITFKGGSLGREGDHEVIIPDVNVSKCHLQFKYDSKSGTYQCYDMGSRNGTILNGQRISVSKSESDAMELVHGSVIQISQTKLLCHIHEGNSTCGLCEPGLLIENIQQEGAANTNAIVHLTHKEQLKKLQKKYGLENEKFVESKQLPGNYNDRAATRRIKVGSSTDKEKTQTSSVDTAISSDNKGFKMLSKLGWNKGETLGKSTANFGLLEPINVASNDGKKGLGCDDPTAGLVLTSAGKKKLQHIQKMQARFQQSTDIFANNDDNDTIKDTSNDSHN